MIREIRERELDEKKAGRPSNHSVLMDNRERVAVTGVDDVESFNEQEVILISSVGGIRIIGQNLHISRLNLEEGQLMIEGIIVALEYEQRAERHMKGTGLLSKIFR